MLNISQNEVPEDWAKQEFQALRTKNTNRSGRIIARWLMALGLMGILCMFLPWQQNIPGKGKLSALDPAHRPQQIQTAIPGRIIRWRVREGQFVNKNDTILELAEIKDDYFDPEMLVRLNEQLTAKEQSIHATERQIEAIRNQLSALKDGLDFSLSKAQNKLQQASMKVRSDSADYEAEKVQFKTAEAQFDRYKVLYEKDGLISLTDLEKRSLKLQETSAKRTSAENKLLASKNERINSRIELSSVQAEYSDKISKAMSDLGSKESYLAEAQSEYSKLRNKIVNVEVRTRNHAILVPQSGYVVKALKMGIGETVKENEPVVTIMPENGMKAVELYVKAMDVPLLTRGRKVRLQFDGWPVLQFSGWPNASVGTFGGLVQVIDYVASSNGQYRILVIPDPMEEGWPALLRLGSGVNGWVMLNDVPIWFELWRQINGFPPTISIEESESGTKEKQDKS
jgi:multidrug efflux pump subunit AcrA (membrane-fusion protein)